MTARFSLHVRLFLAAILSVACGLVVAGFVLSTLFEQHVVRQAETDLGAQLDGLVAAVDVAGVPYELTRTPTDPRFHVPFAGRYWQIEMPDGRVLRSRSLWDEKLALPSDELNDGVIHRHAIAGPKGQKLLVLERAVFPPRSDGAIRLAVGMDRKPIHEATERFRGMLALSLGVLGIALVAASVAFVRLGLSPLRRLRQSLAEVLDGGRKRLPETFPGEIEPLARELNHLLDRNDEALERARATAGNLAHALKTPLAVMNNDISQLGQSGVAPDTAGRLAEEIGRMREQIERQLAAARAAAGIGTGRTAVAGEAVENVMRALGRLYPDLSFRADVPDVAVFAGDRTDFEEMLGNLFENACKWARHTVKVSGRVEGRELVLCVEDDGPGLPAEERTRVLARGVRLDERGGGQGFGLAIVADLAKLYGGTLRLDASALGGLMAELRLPRR